MALRTDKPKINSVYIKVQEVRAGKYIGSKGMTVYDATALEVMNLIRSAIKSGGGKSNGKQ